MSQPEDPIIRSGEARTLIDGPLGAYLLADGSRTAGRVSFVLHTLAPRALGSPVHTHRNEDEWSFVLSGLIGVEIGGDVSVVEPEALILKPRGVGHAFWNAGDEPARLLEVITPAGFEGYFQSLGEVLSSSVPLDPNRLAEIAAAYDLELDPSSIPRLVQAHGLRLS